MGDTGEYNSEYVSEVCFPLPAQEQLVEMKRKVRKKNYGEPGNKKWILHAEGQGG